MRLYVALKVLSFHFKFEIGHNNIGNQVNTRKLFIAISQI